MNISTTHPITFNLYEELPEPIYNDMKDKEAKKIQDEKDKNEKTS